MYRGICHTGRRKEINHPDYFQNQFNWGLKKGRHMPNYWDNYSKWWISLEEYLHIHHQLVNNNIHLCLLSKWCISHHCIVVCLIIFLMISSCFRSILCDNSLRMFLSYVVDILKCKKGVEDEGKFKFSFVIDYFFSITVVDFFVF